MKISNEFKGKITLKLNVWGRSKDATHIENHIE